MGHPEACRDMTGKDSASAERGRLILAVVWTSGTLAMAAAFDGQMQGWERAALWAFPVFGAVFTGLSWLHLRRARSLRVETEQGVSVFVWTDLSGRECRSDRDPRPDWEGDGDSGSGGDGGGD
jgi:hypothetical protein